MTGLFGVDALLIDGAIRQHAVHVHSCVKYFSRDPKTVEQSVARHWDTFHRLMNDLRKALNVAKKTFDNGTWKGFINLSLSAEQKEQYASWDIEDSDVWLGLATYGEKGYKFSLTYNVANSNWVATYTGQEQAGKNSGYAVTGFASDPYNAARVLLFKVSCILPDVWKDFAPLPLDTIG